MSKYVPGQQTATRYHRMRLVNKHRMITRMSRNRVNQLHMANESINQSHMWGPHQSPFYENKFTLILKHFKIMEVVKVTCREENGGKIY